MRTGEDDLSIARDGWEDAVAENHRLDALVKEMLEALKDAQKVLASFGLEYRVERTTVETAIAKALGAK